MQKDDQLASCKREGGGEGGQERAQLQREQRELQRTRQAKASQERRLKEQGRESSLRYGQALFKERAALVTTALNAVMAEWVANPSKPGKFYAALPWLARFESHEQVAVVSLAAVIDQITRKLKYQAMAQSIGAALEDEQRALRLRSKSPMEFMRLVRKCNGNKRQLVSPKTMEMLGVPTVRWENKVRFEVGAHMLELIRANTDLIEFRLERRGKISSRYVMPSQKALDFIRACPPASYQPTRTPMACPPRPWEALWCGGHLTNTEPFIKVPLQDIGCREEAGMAYLKDADLSKVYAAANYLQQTELRVDPWMVEQQRIAWDAGIKGLFPCARNPLPVPDELPDGSSEADWKVRNTQAWLAHRDQRENGPKRVRIERSIQLAEEIAGESMWNAYHLDFRGRLFTSNRYVTHQGPDHEKAAVAFGQAQRLGTDGLDWLLKAAAGHYGLGRASWSDRLSWGQERLQQICAAGLDPFERLELWRDAKDPWQFLQVAREIAKAVGDDGYESAVPIRLDQTTSGCGILAALVRNKEVGRLCNLWGKTPKDLYGVIAARVNERLNWLQHNGETHKERSLAELWLAQGVDRGWVKGPVLSTPYGASYMSIVNGIMDRLEEKLGEVGPREYPYKVAMPGHFLAKIVRQELLQVVAPCMEVSRWLKKVGKKCGQANQAVHWTTPMGLPIHLAERVPIVEKVTTLLFGKRTYTSLMDQPLESPISGRLINRSISANLVHSFDAALCQAVICGAAGQRMQLLTNHDCFAARPGEATQLHRLLHDELRSMYRTDWLEEIALEISITAGVALPPPPMDGSLPVGQIGSNDYCFS